MARLSHPLSPVKRSISARQEPPGSSTPSTSTLSYTLPLRDGALGTTPLSHHRPPWTLLRADAPLIASGLPSIFLAYYGHISRAWKTATWLEIREESCYLLASLLELYLPILTLSLWLFMPGPWVILFTSPVFLTIYVLLRLVNQGSGVLSPSSDATIAPKTSSNNYDRLHQHHQRRKSSSSSSLTPGDRFHYILLPSRLLTSRAHTRTVTIPRLARLFNPSGSNAMKIHAYLPLRLGLPLDLLIWLLQRNDFFSPSAFSPSLSHILYSDIRTYLQRTSPGSSLDGVRLLAHGSGALDAAWLVSRLCADLPSAPSSGLGRLEVFTFGGAGMEMVTPLEQPGSGVTMSIGGEEGIVGGVGGAARRGGGGDIFEEPRQQEQLLQQQAMYPTVSHYAFEDDPFAQRGVLYGIRKRLEGRVVGELFAIQTNNSTTRTTTAASRRQQRQKGGPTGGERAGARGWMSRYRDARWTLDDYLDALFPKDSPDAGVLGQVCRIEREVSEMRELAALAQSVQQQQLEEERSRSRKKRLSWTALGALAGKTTSSSEYGGAGEYRHDLMPGALSLEEVRRQGKALRGMRGYENNRLAAAVRRARRLNMEVPKLSVPR